MTTFTSHTLELDHKFNPYNKRHSINGHDVALHCHHFTTLYTQLAIDSGKTNLLVDCAERSFYPMLQEYFNSNGISNITTRIENGCQLYSAVGLGSLTILNLGDDTGEAEMTVSHVDKGWIKKWGNSDKPVNYIGCGFIAALASVVLDQPIGTFLVTEVRSIAMGELSSIFNIVRK
jgi:hypothetical protein